MAVKEIRRKLFKNLKGLYDFKLPPNIRKADIEVDLGAGISTAVQRPRSFQTKYQENPEAEDTKNDQYRSLANEDISLALKELPLRDIQIKIQIIWDRLAEIASIKSQDFSLTKVIEISDKRHDDSASARTGSALHTVSQKNNTPTVVYTGERLEDLEAYATRSSNTNTNLRFFQKGLIARIKSFTNSKDTALAKSFLTELSKLNDSLEQTKNKLSPFDIAKRKIQINLATKKSLDFLSKQKQTDLDQNLSDEEQRRILTEIQGYDELDLDGIDRDKMPALASLVLEGRLSDEAIGENHDAALIRLLRSIKIRAQSSLNLLQDTLISVKNLARIILNKQPVITEYKSKDVLGKLDVTEKAILDESSASISVRLKTGIQIGESSRDWIRPSQTDLEKFGIKLAA